MEEMLNCLTQIELVHLIKPQGFVGICGRFFQFGHTSNLPPHLLHLTRGLKYRISASSGYLETSTTMGSSRYG